MENQEFHRLLTEYNSLYKEMDEVYHALARHYGLSDCALWILYLLRETDETHTQSEIGEQLSLSKQTINSALKKLEKVGYIKLDTHPGNQKNKLVVLTDHGRLFSEETIDHVLKMERTAFEQFTIEERTTLLQLARKHVHQLQKEAEKILAPGQQ